MQRLSIALCLVLLTACGFVHDERIDGPYRLVAIDTMSDMMVCIDVDGGICHGRTPSTTTGYGFNDRWITASVRRGPSMRTEYYFIDRALDRSHLNAAEVTQGPLSEAEFLARSQQLGLPLITRRLDP